jgi:hypothetical protein
MTDGTPNQQPRLVSDGAFSLPLSDTTSRDVMRQIPFVGSNGQRRTRTARRERTPYALRCPPALADPLRSLKVHVHAIRVSRGPLLGAAP